MPVVSVMRDRMLAVEARGWSEREWSALGKLAATGAALTD
jgi:hypothetical protein